MKIGIITLPGCYVLNFGNRLQNYAVQHVLQSKFGCETDTLVALEWKAFKNGNYLAWLKEQVARTLCIIPSIARKKWGPGIARLNHFSSWSRRHTSTKTFYKHPSLPESLNQKYDMFFVGSDQVWNYHFSSMFHKNYFLEFADAKKRVAFCASFGVDAIPENLKQRYAEGLSGLEHISVREYEGAKIIKSLIDKDVPVLVDPVMLLSREEWLKVSRKPRVDISRPYVLKYFLGDDDRDDQVDLWAKENGYAVYELLNKANADLFSAGPGEFISLIANASFVASDSFHCIAFSIIFKKPFIAYTREPMNSRLVTLLKLFGFEDRWANLLSPNNYLDCNHLHTDEILRSEQEKSFGFIKKALGLGE